MTGFPSRQELLGGLPARRATTLLFAIESRTAQLVAEARRALVPRLTERSVADDERAFLAAIAAGRVERPVRVQDLERYADRWRDLVPDDPALKAELARLILAKYRVPSFARRLRDVLGLHDPAAPFTRALTVSERYAWLRSRFSDRLERMPPFWIAYALTLTETVGGGILALPIVVASLGMLGALAVVICFGLLNVLAIAALSESIIRNGHMRYGNAYFGRLVADYLGRGPALIVLSVALTLFLIVVLMMGLIGFGDVLAAATGVHSAIWAAGLFVITLLVLARGSLDATIAAAIVIGSINLVVLLVIAGVAFASPSGAAGDPGAGPQLGASPAGFDPASLALAFGVLLAAYFGHLSVGNAAKVVLRRDPGGRSLLFGSALATASVIVVYLLVTAAIFSAVDETTLVGQTGTFITPLAEAAGPVILILGAVYASLALGLGSLHVSLSLYNVAGEAIQPLGARLGETGRAVLRSGLSRFVFRTSPIIAVFALIELLLVTGTANFSGPLGVVGALTVPMLGGVFPIMMVAAARRRGDRVPDTFLGLVGRAPVIAALWVFYVAGILVHAAIWQSLPEKVVAIAVSAGMVAVTVLILRRGALRRTASLEVRYEPERTKEPEVSVVSNGRPVDATLDGPAPDELRVRLPRLDVQELKVWAHRVTPVGDSEALPVAARLERDGTLEADPTSKAGDHAIVLNDEGEAVVPLDGQPVTVVFDGLARREDLTGGASRSTSAMSLASSKGLPTNDSAPT